MNDTLEPCPFCGSTNTDPKEWMAGDGSQGPGCGNCGATARSVAEWNAASRLRADRDRLLEELRVMTYQRDEWRDSLKPECAENDRLRGLLRYAQGFVPVEAKDVHARIDAALAGADQPSAAPDLVFLAEYHNSMTVQGRVDALRKEFERLSRAADNAAATPQPSARHPGYILGNHWLETAYERVCAGDDEAEIMADYGWTPNAARLSAEDVEHFHPRVAKLIRKGEPFFVVKASEPYASEVVDLIRRHEGIKWTDEDEQWAREALRAADNG